MGLRTFLKRALGKTETAIDVAGDKFDDVSGTVKKTGSLIAEDASEFAKKTIFNLLDASSELREKSKEAAKDFKERRKEDVLEVKEIAEKQFVETSAFVHEQVVKVEEALKGHHSNSGDETEKNNDN